MQASEIENTAAQYLEFMIHGFMNGLITLQELEGVSDDEMETIYALGYNFFTYGKYDAAKDIFTGLTAYAPYTAHYWRALGAVNQQIKDYTEAIAAYDMAIANDVGLYHPRRRHRQPRLGVAGAVRTCSLQ